MKPAIAIAALGLLAAPAFADDVNVKPGTLPNEMALAGKVQIDIVCVVDDAALMKNCRIADGTKASPADTQTAIEMVDGHSHVAGHYTPGETVKLKVTLAEHRASTQFMLLR